jgi:surfeit locus 1 family protein
MVKALFSRQWWLLTLLVMAAVGVMARLGVWQLDRLAARRVFNARVSEQLSLPALELSGAALAADLPALEYRTVTVTGAYDFAEQVALRNQAWDEGQATVRAGAHLLTPLVISGTDRAVLVDRGWIPLDQSAPAAWTQFDEPGTVTVSGAVRRSEERADFGSVSDPAGRLAAWNLVNLPRLSEQISHPLLSVYIQQAPDPARTALPYRSPPDLDLSEGPHLGYAIQWFGFALVLAAGYPFYIRDTQRRRLLSEAA